MEQLITSYGIDFIGFQDLICSTTSIVAGSAPLSLYLKQNGLSSFEPGDLDIWIGVSQPIHGSITSFLAHSDISRIFHFLIRQGYNAVDRSEVMRYPSMDGIQTVLELVDRGGHCIQLIVVQCRELVEYISAHFDLSCCMTWWDTRVNKMDTMYPEYTDHMKMFSCNVTPEDTEKERYQIRITKYKSRGFSYAPYPPPCVLRPDLRECLSAEGPLTRKKAFDVIAHEEVDAVGFLRESPWNILLVVGGQFFAYHRMQLMNAMKSTRREVPYLGEVYDTPHRQTVIGANAVNKLGISDYSIYALNPRYSYRPTPTVTKSLHDLLCYTVDGWIAGRHGYSIIVPPREMVHDAEEVKEDPLPPVVVPPAGVNPEALHALNLLAEYGGVSDDEIEDQRILAFLMGVSDRLE